NPISNVYVINLRNQRQHVSRSNGVFDVWLLPSDSLLITHVTYSRKIISTFDLQMNPIIKLEPDTVEINQVNVYETAKTDYERAMENINEINWDARPIVTDIYTESERMKQLLQTENRVERAAASSLTYGFSPSEVIGIVVHKIKIRKKSNQYNSEKKRKKNRNQK
ncbi:MAG: hypothetical protein JXR61_01880, partial [Prolixibacteraceae bacterium]|nr:hypothetical protein [Prolixibacteraceae bacterium]